jgi:hypothetical protein
MARASTNEGAVQVDQSRQTMTATLMYLYQGYLSGGMSESEAKSAVADEVIGLMAQWQTMTGLEFNTSPIMNPKKMLDELIQITSQETTAPAAPSKAKWQDVHRKLIDLKAMVKKVTS